MEQAVNTKTSVQTFEELLAGSVAAHGHLCPGQIVGVRMALLGLRLLDFEAPPTYPQLKQLIVFVEMDRCTGDAVAYVTNAKLGRRSLKFVDYGIMAATFMNLETGRAFRIISTEESRESGSPLCPQETGQASASNWRPTGSCRIASCSGCRRCKVDLTPFDLPGPTRRKVTCVQCGQVVRDNREVSQERSAVYCRPCAGGPISTGPREIAWEK